MSEPSFVFMTCQPGAEAALKHEVATRQRDLRFAYSRPGFVTFKSESALKPNDFFASHWTFARTHGISLARVQGGYLKELAQQVWQEPQVKKLLEEVSLHAIHVWQREADHQLSDQTGADAPLESMVAAQLIEGATKIGLAAAKIFLPDSTKPTRRQRNVLDVVISQPDEWWLGWHHVVQPQHGWPGGQMPLKMPPHAVSRAYAKMQEALAWSQFPLREGDEWVEIGCAPGGACQALLDRGQYVTGIDPAEVDPKLLGQTRFRHLRKRGVEVKKQEFRDVDWLAADLNVDPENTLAVVEDIASHRLVHVRGMVLTLKLTTWKLAEKLPEYLERIRGWGFRYVRVRQLASSGQEVCVVVLKNRALKRLSSRARQRRSAAARPSRRVDSAHAAPPQPHCR